MIVCNTKAVKKFQIRWKQCGKNRHQRMRQPGCVAANMPWPVNECNR